nr:serine/threonine-protein phosphatase 6 regulatory ankyrin repeat subunit A-like [Penaeus vannamei]
MIHSASGKSGKCLHYLGGESWSRWCFPLISPLRTRGRKVVGTINQRGNMTLIVRAMGRGLRRSPAVHYHPGGARQPQGPYQCPVRMPFRSPRALLQRAAPDGDASPLGTPPGRWHSRLGDASRALLSACGSWRWMTVVEADPALLQARDEDGYTPLHLATIAGNKAVVKYLISKGADISALDNEKHTVIHWATVCGEVELLELLIEAGANPSTPDIHGAYPLHYAAQMCGPNSEMGNDIRVGLMVLRKLLQSGVDVSVTDQDGRQPLLWAASAGSADAILALVNAGASVSAEDKDGLTALHCAASRGHLDCLDCLVTLCGAEVDTLDSNGCTPLFYAVTLGHADCTQLLLHHGAHTDRQDRKGRTPAHCGAAKGQLETLKLLHQKGADLWRRNVKGDLPLHEACQSGRKDLVVWLLSMRPDTVNAPNLDGRCPLHIAAINNNIEMCKILMDQQAAVNPIMRNSRGQLLTPLDAAVARSNRGCAKYLQLHGGVPASKLTDKHALQKAMQRALEASQHGSTGATPSDLTGDELMSSSASSALKSNRSTMTASPVNTEAQTDTGDLKRGGAGDTETRKPQSRDAQESGYSDSLMPERDSDEDGPTDPERNTDDEDGAPHASKKTKTKTRRRRAQKLREDRQGAMVIAEDVEGGGSGSGGGGGDGGDGDDGSGFGNGGGGAGDGGGGSGGSGGSGDGISGGGVGVGGRQKKRRIRWRQYCRGQSEEEKRSGQRRRRLRRGLPGRWRLGRIRR